MCYMNKPPKLLTTDTNGNHSILLKARMNKTTIICRNFTNYFFSAKPINYGQNFIENQNNMKQVLSTSPVKAKLTQGIERKENFRKACNYIPCADDTILTFNCS